MGSMEYMLGSLVAGSGHSVFIDKSAEFNKIVKDFISKK